jgi:hypothetical protein
MQEKLDDHENRLRKLEQNSLEIKYELATVSKNQTDLKSLVLETNRDNTKFMNDNFTKLISLFSETQNTKNKIRLMDRKEIWGVIGVLLAFGTNFILKIVN